MKIIKYLLLMLLNMAVPAVAAQQKLAAQEAPVDAETEKQIDDLINKIAIPTTIAEYASNWDWEKVKELAVKKGTDINARGSSNNTALTWAARFVHDDVIKLLIDNGSNVHAQDDHGRTALMYVNVRYRDDLQALYAVRCIQLLIKAGANPNHQDKNGNTALMWAAEQGCLNTVKALIASGADYTMKNNFYETALVRAQRFGIGNQEAVIDYLQKLQQPTHIQSKL